MYCGGHGNRRTDFLERCEVLSRAGGGGAGRKKLGVKRKNFKSQREMVCVGGKVGWGWHMSKRGNPVYAAVADKPFLKSRRGRAETKLEKNVG